MLYSDVGRFRFFLTPFLIKPYYHTFYFNRRAIMAKKMDFVEFVSDLPDEEGDAPEMGLASGNESIPSGVYYRVDGSKVVLLKDQGCKKQQ